MLTVGPDNYSQHPEDVQQEKDFIRAICKEPEDLTARLVYADWLDEHKFRQTRSMFMRYEIFKNTGLGFCPDCPADLDKEIEKLNQPLSSNDQLIGTPWYNLACQREWVCPMCRGEGKVLRNVDIILPNESMTCPTCNGSKNLMFLPWSRTSQEISGSTEIDLRPRNLIKMNRRIGFKYGMVYNIGVNLNYDWRQNRITNFQREFHPSGSDPDQKFTPSPWMVEIVKRQPIEYFRLAPSDIAGQAVSHFRSRPPSELFNTTTGTFVTEVSGLPDELIWEMCRIGGSAQWSYGTPVNKMAMTMASVFEFAVLVGAAMANLTRKVAFAESV